jgi:hypothetical protein
MLILVGAILFVVVEPDANTPAATASASLQLLSVRLANPRSTLAVHPLRKGRAVQATRLQNRP